MRTAIGEEAAREKGKVLRQVCSRAELSGEKEERQKAAAAALRLIGEGADLDCVDEAGFSCLMNLSGSDELDTVAPRLIAAGAKLDVRDKMAASTALVYACIAGRATTAMRLIDAGAALNVVSRTSNMTALDAANRRGLASVSSALRALGGCTGAELKAVREQGELDRAARAKLSKTKKAATKAGEQLTAACMAAANPFSTDAVVKDCTAAALRLIGEGADPSIVDDKFGFTPLMWASGGTTSGTIAVRLVAAGARLDHTDGRGNSALSLACSFKCAATAMLLIESGASINIATHERRTALDCANEAGLASVAAAIRARGGLTGVELAASRANA